jgi:outer membrane protein assembly factor BamD (BamD/ComL family)
MYLGRHYLKKKKWIAAINRFKTVLEEYDTTIFIEEALHRLVEVHYKLGLNRRGKKICISYWAIIIFSNGMKILIDFLIKDMK